LTTFQGATIIGFDFAGRTCELAVARMREGVGSVTRVVVRADQSFEDAYRIFKKKVQADRILSEVRRRRYFEKPSVIRKRKKAAKLRKSRRQALKQQRRNER
jgi:small subunit ribosomal protein S21